MSDEPEQHRPDGLDLAKALTRATARIAGAASAPKKLRKQKQVPRGNAGVDPSEPRPLGEAVDRMVGDLGWELPLRMHSVFVQWDQLVGEEIAGHCAPTAFVDGVVTVQADSTTWANSLRLLAPQLVRRLNEDLGEGTVTAVEILGPNGPTWRHGKLRARGGRGPRDTYG